MDKLNRISQDIMLALGLNQDLLKLLYYKDKDVDLEELEDVDFEQVVNKNLFDYTYVPKTESKADVYMSVTIDNMQKSNTKSGQSETVRQMDIVITIFSHYDVIKFYNGNRIMAIVDKIEDIFSSAHMEDILGKFNFSILKEITTVPDYSGYNLIFNINAIPDRVGRQGVW